MKRKRYRSEFKAKLALEVGKAQRPLNEIARDSGMHPTQLLPRQKHWLESLPSVFADKRCKAQQEQRPTKRTCIKSSVNSRWSWIG